MVQPLDRRLMTEATFQAKAAEQDGRLDNYETRVESIETLGGLAPGDVSDATVASVVANPESQARAALSAAFMGKGELVINALDYGAVPSPTVDQSAALSAAAAAAFAAHPDAILFVPRGNYRIDSMVSVRCALDASQATFTYHGAGTALEIGSSIAGVVTARRTFRLPRVVKAGRVSGWDGATIGVQAFNLNTCEVFVPFVQDFEQGYVANGNSGGYAYTNHYLGALWENHKNLVLVNTSTGYTNQNQFYGGRLQHSLTKGAVADDMNACQIYMASTNPEGGPNNNTFIGTSLEGENVAYYRVDIAGSYNMFLNCRWESPAGVSPRVRYRSTALRNEINGGYGVIGIVETFDGTLGGGALYDTQGAYMSATLATPAATIPNDTVTTIKTWNAPVSRRIAYDPATGAFTPRPGRWLIGASVTFAPNATGRRIANITAGGSNIDTSEAPGNAVRTTLKLQGVYRFNGAQDFRIDCRQTSGADLALEGTSPYVRVWAEYLGY